MSANKKGVSGSIFEKHFSNFDWSSLGKSSTNVFLRILPGILTLVSIFGREFESVNKATYLLSSSSINNLIYYIFE